MTINKRKKHDQLLMLAESKFNSIETLISQALGDLDISHKEFIMISKEKDKYERMKSKKLYKIKKINAIIFFFIFPIYKRWT